MNRAPSDWYADEDLWIETYSYMFPESRVEAGVEEVGRIIDLTRCDSGAVLDLCCGPGRHSVPLAMRGFAVTAVDRTRYLLDRARAFADTQQVEVEFVEEDMRRFRRPESFDLALSMLTSFGYFDDPAENQQVLENVYTNLRPGGVFIVDMMGKEVLARIFLPTSCDELDDGTLIFQRREPVDDWSRMENEWFILKGGSVRLFRLRHWIYSGRELREMLAAAGFSKIDIYGDLGGSSYDNNASRMIGVARKGVDA
ncbi:MAG: class I SAM-dependent methyltransferase [Gemmatimonadota bacterium]|nr:MAG: class I SAM-dependent methyltransferase [Gemmatimonadota bacterium]